MSLLTKDETSNRGVVEVLIKFYLTCILVLVSIPGFFGAPQDNGDSNTMTDNEQGNSTAVDSMIESNSTEIDEIDEENIMANETSEYLMMVEYDNNSTSEYEYYMDDTTLASTTSPIEDTEAPENPEAVKDTYHITSHIIISNVSRNSQNFQVVPHIAIHNYHYSDNQNFNEEPKSDQPLFPTYQPVQTQDSTGITDEPTSTTGMPVTVYYPKIPCPDSSMFAEFEEFCIWKNMVFELPYFAANGLCEDLGMKLLSYQIYYYLVIKNHKVLEIRNTWLQYDYGPKCIFADDNGVVDKTECAEKKLFLCYIDKTEFFY